jgi:hypothetical protein
MVKILKIVLLCTLIFVGKQPLAAQDTLPNFTVEDKGEGRIVVSWQNPYDNLVQLAVQRSLDSVKRFSSVFSATSPELPLNGYSDKVPPGLHYFYRIFYVMRGGTYYFSKSKKPVTSGATAREYDSRRDQLGDNILKRIETAESNGTNNLPAVENKPIFVKTRSGLLTLKPVEFKGFRDSVLAFTNDTLVQTGTDTVAIELYSPPFLQRNSQYVFTDRDGFIVVKLPDDNKKYELIFLEEDDTPVLEFKTLKKQQFTIDKTNFYHGGWYKFEIRENGRIKERNKVYLPTDL